jgi:toxin ParE1/3/4
MRTLRIARLADEDIVSILRWSLGEFGPAACRRYEALLTVALESLREDPERFGSIARPEFGTAIRTYHLRFSRDKARTPEGVVHRPRHQVAYRTLGEWGLEIIRILHDSMELQRHLRGSVEDSKSEDPDA